MDREEIQRLTKEEISRRIREGVKAAIGHGQSPYSKLALIQVLSGLCAGST
jgi:hypothetical protein